MANQVRDIDLADATRVRVLETVILHGRDVIYWLDGSTADTPAQMTRIARPLAVQFTAKPRAIRFLHSPGKTAFWSDSDANIQPGETTDEQRKRPLTPAFVVAGIVEDPYGRFNPVAFEASLGTGNGKAVVLYPTPLGVAKGPGGLAQGRVMAGAKPLAWGLVTLEVTIAPGESLSFTGQTNAQGDFRIALTRLPPLPLSTTEYSGRLRIVGDINATADTPIKLTGMPALNIESLSEAGTFLAQVPLVIRPGEVLRVNSFNKSFIAVQTV